jgi:hypothetical protein
MGKAVRIEKIREIKGGAFQLTVSQEIVRENQSSSLTSMLMDGHPGFGVRKPAISWQNVSAKMMAKFGFQVGDNLSEKLGLEVNLQVKESTSPSDLWTADQFTFTNKEGKKVHRQPKTNPSTGAILVHDNKPIYRKVDLVSGVAKHEYVQHNGIVIPVAAPTKMQPNENIMAD